MPIHLNVTSCSTILREFGMIRFSAGHTYYLQTREWLNATSDGTRDHALMIGLSVSIRIVLKKTFSFFVTSTRIRWVPRSFGRRPCFTDSGETMRPARSVALRSVLDATNTSVHFVLRWSHEPSIVSATRRSEAWAEDAASVHGHTGTP